MSKTYHSIYIIFIKHVLFVSLTLLYSVVCVCVCVHIISDKTNYYQRLSTVVEYSLSFHCA